MILAANANKLGFKAYKKSNNRLRKAAVFQTGKISWCPTVFIQVTRSKIHICIVNKLIYNKKITTKTIFLFLKVEIFKKSWIL